MAVAARKELTIVRPRIVALSVSAVLLAGALAAPAGGQSSPGRPSLTDARVVRDPGSGLVTMIGSEAGEAVEVGGATPTATSEAFLEHFGHRFGLKDASTEAEVARTLDAGRSRTVTRFEQIHDGVPVVGGEIAVMTDGSGGVISASGEVSPDLEVPTTPGISAGAARDAAVESVAKEHHVNESDLDGGKATLSIYDPALVGPEGGPTRLVWRFEVRGGHHGDIDQFVLVDAERGGIALSFSQIAHAKDRRVCDNANTSTLPCASPYTRSEGGAPAGEVNTDAVYTILGHTYDFLSSHFQIDSIDDAGLPLIGTVNYRESSSVEYRNAFWNGTQTVFGADLGQADDVVAHEVAHGLTQYTSDLFYYYQSGAINEMMSDVFGEFVDLTNGYGMDTTGVRWQLGEDSTAFGGAIRNMADPPAFSDPDRMTSVHYYEGASDRGGVHTNSGVGNKAAFLMTDGATFNGHTVTGMGIAKVARVYFEAQMLLTSGSDYLDLYHALIQGCTNAIGGTAGITAANCVEVTDAVDAVEMDGEPAVDFNSHAPICPDGFMPDDVFFDGIETHPSSRWTQQVITGANRWRWDSPDNYGGPFAHSGRHSLYADDWPASSTDSAYAQNVARTVPADAYLHFAHAYGFETNFDGGVLEYSTDGGTTWLDAGPLFTHNGYDGTLPSGNPLGARGAFRNDSHGYITSRVDLASLAGQNIRFRFRMGLDSSVSDWGWWVDDIRMYTCVLAPRSLTVTKAGSGKVTSQPAGINCGATCKADFDAGAPVTITAKPAKGWFFKKWAGACTGARPCKLKMDEDRVARATFKRKQKTSVDLSVSKNRKSIQAAGSVAPKDPGEKMKIVLYRKNAKKKFVKVDASSPKLNQKSAYSTRFARPNAGNCKIKAVYPGDGRRLPSRTSSKFNC